MLEIAKAAETEALKTRLGSRPCKLKIEGTIEEVEERELEMISNGSNSDCILVKMRGWVL